MTAKTELETAGSHSGISRVRRLLLVGAALIVALPANAAVRYVVRGGYYFGPGFGPWGWYDPYFYHGAYPVIAHPNAGQVKFDTKAKNAQVYIDGAFAGTAGELKSIWLRQGTYNIEVRSPGGATYSERIYVVNGKTLHMRPDSPAEPKS